MPSHTPPTPPPERSLSDQETIMQTDLYATISTGTPVTLHSGRVARVSPRTYTTCTGYVAWLTAAEAKALRLAGYSTGRYSYSVDMSGDIERWINGYGGWIARVQAPTVIRDLY
jgi:hypothetical protein